jgi:hypothetical protein
VCAAVKLKGKISLERSRLKNIKMDLQEVG